MIEEDLKRIADALEKIKDYMTQPRVYIDDNSYPIPGFAKDALSSCNVAEVNLDNVVQEEEPPVKPEPKKRKSKKAEPAPVPETPVEIEEVNATTATEAPATDTPTILEEPKQMTYLEARAELLAFCKDRDKGNKILREVLDAHKREGFLDYSDAKPGEFAEIVNEFKAKYAEVANA